MSTNQKGSGVYKLEPQYQDSGGSVGNRLNLCCGDYHWEGFVNIDVWYGGMTKPDFDCDVRKLPYLPNTMEEIQCIHGLEHFPRWQVVSILIDWRRMLVPGGLLVLEMPCLNMIIEILHKHPTPDSLPEVWHKLKDGRTVNKHIDAMGGLYGEQDPKKPHMVHKWCYSSQELREVLEAAGFENMVFKDPLYHRPFRDMRVEVRK